VTHSPPPSADFTALLREQAVAAFDPSDAPQVWLNGTARLAILFPPGFVVSASAAMLALFGVKDCEALEARLARGEGPSPRRLRRLMATLPVDGPPRLEPIRVVVERRPAGVNLHCIRIGGPAGATWFLASAPALGAASGEEPAPASEVPPSQAHKPAATTSAGGPVADLASAPQNARFLWTLDEEGRFGAVHPALVAAVGPNAPHRGESVEALLRRAQLAGADKLIRVLSDRQTFAGVTVEWPLPGLGLRRRVALSAAPLFGRRREFLGYRGFGVLGDEVEAAAAPEDDPSAAQRQDDRCAPTGVVDPPPEVLLETDGGAPALSHAFNPERSSSERDFEAEPLGYASAADLIQPSLEFSPGDDLEAGPVGGLLDTGGATATMSAEAAPSEGFAPEVQTRETAAEPAETNLQHAPAHAPEGSRTEASPEPEGPKSAPALPEAGEADAVVAEAAQPDLADGAAASEPPPERSAEIYVLRHPSASFSSNIVPIRPGALDALAREPAQSFPTESVELSRSERDAFKEIARALVGRAPASRDEHGDEQRDSSREPATDARADEPTDRQGAGADGDEVRRNAGVVLDRLPLGALIVRDGRALYANRTLLEFVGYRDFAEFQAANALSRMFRDRDPQTMTAEDAGAVAIVRADGQILSVDGHAQVISWDGAPATLIALRRSLEAELRARLRAADSEAPTRSGLASDLQAMLDRATDGAVTLDSAGRILSLNEPAERLFGYRQNGIAGESLLMLLAPQSHPETTARLEALSCGGEVEAGFRPLQVVGRDRDGASIPLALTLARTGPSDAPQFCALARDLRRERETERRLIAAREAAEAASAAKTDFLAQVSHEVRTPLHAILGFAEVMLEERFGPVGNERYKDYLKDIHTSGSHVMSLADDLLDLSKIEAGKLELAFASVDANSVIRECVSLMQPQAARERVIMRVSLHDRLPRVMVDERSLKQIMLNLMSNAVKFNEPGGQVIVSTAVDAAGQAVIRVRDTGVGMNENEVGLALTPFSQVGKAGAKGGAGLGLPLTKALVEANKAEFSIKSRREQGTLIEIAFPNIQAAQ
jgi:PAS domain S-box-containing protein